MELEGICLVISVNIVDAAAPIPPEGGRSERPRLPALHLRADPSLGAESHSEVFIRQVELRLTGLATLTGQDAQPVSVARRRPQRGAQAHQSSSGDDPCSLSIEAAGGCLAGFLQLI